MFPTTTTTTTTVDRSLSTDLLEAAITQIWADVLELPSFTPQDNFLDLGGDSISATQVVSRLRDQFGATISLDLMFDQMTVGRLAQIVATQRQHNHTGTQQPSLPRIAPQPRDQSLSTSHCQRRMWLVQQFAPESTAYNVPFALRLKGPLNRSALNKAVQTVWSQHEVFRTSFTATSKGLQQSIVDALPPIQMLEADLGPHPEADQEGLARQLLHHSATTPFDLTSPLLWRCHLVRLNDNDHILAWIAHHIIIDLWSNLNLTRELAQTYSALCQGQTPVLARHTTDCADHAHWQLSPPVMQYLDPQLQYWLDQLKDLPPLSLPTDKPATPHWYRSGKRITKAIPTSTLNGLAKMAASGGHSPFMILLACLNVLLSRQARQTDIAVATPIANRHHADTEHLVASLVNTLVMRNDLSGDPTFQDLLDRVKATALKAYAHQDLPFDLLVEKLGATHRHQDTPLGLSVMLNVPNAAQGQAPFHELDTSRFLFDRGSTQFPLTLVVDTEQTRHIFLEYADTLFAEATASALVDNYLTLLNQVMAEPQARLSTLKWLSLAERAQLQRWNDTTTEQDPANVHALDLISEQARRHPHALAISFGDQTVSYADLLLQARHIAQSLRDHGIGHQHRVGICLERAPDLVASVLAIWMTGAAYVPLDPAYPAERLQYMASDAKLSLVITHESLESRMEWPPGLQLLLDHAVAATIRGSEAPRPVDSDDAAYIIYTSGSTGQPKGVVIPHRSLGNFLTSMANMPGLGARDRLLAVTTLSFDISVLELLLPLTVGAHIVMANSDDVLDGHALNALMTQHQISVMQATPSTWRLLIDAGWTGRTTGFKALVGGEPLTNDLAAQLLIRAEQVWNMYGPTETTVWSTCWRVNKPADGIRIGSPIANTQVWILDEHGHHCPVGTPGEIAIAGDGVASGYWNRESTTHERFVPTHFSDKPGARLYRTGDLGRWLWSGELEHLGRLDFQIKVRGHRIEPGEIETQLSRHPAVARAVVIAREDTPGDVRLVAYVVPRQSMPSMAVLREHARHCLPDHMQPQHYVALPAIPLLANGKVNRQALPPPTITAHESPPQNAPSPSLSADTQKLLALIWQELLGVKHIQAHDNFFDLGGHSLLAVQAIAKMEKVTGKRVNARRYIFETLAQLANSYDQASSETTAPAAPVNAPGLLQRWLGRNPKQ